MMHTSRISVTTRGREALRRLVLSAMLLSIGWVLPFFTGQIPEIGSMLLPMHIPALLCGLICGWQYGGAVGLLLPLTRSLMFGMPPLYPTAAAMAVELCLYGLVSGLMSRLISRLCKRQGLLSVYASMLVAMLVGRGGWGLTQWLLLGLEGTPFTLEAFLAGAFTTALPGILLQLVLIPTVMTLLHRSRGTAGRGREG